MKEPFPIRAIYKGYLIEAKSGPRPFVKIKVMPKTRQGDLFVLSVWFVATQHKRLCICFWGENSKPRSHSQISPCKSYFRRTHLASTRNTLVIIKNKNSIRNLVSGAYP